MLFFLLYGNKKKTFWHVPSCSCALSTSTSRWRACFPLPAVDYGWQRGGVVGMRTFLKTTPFILDFHKLLGSLELRLLSVFQEKRAPLWKMRAFIFSLAALGEFSLNIFMKMFCWNLTGMSNMSCQIVSTAAEHVIQTICCFLLFHLCFGNHNLPVKDLF